MNLRQHLKFLTFVSIVSVSLVLVVTSITSDFGLAAIISSVADIIQIVTYGVWLWQKEVSMAEVPEQVKEVYHFITREREESRVTGEIISRLVKEGVVREDELFKLIRRKEIILAFPYAEGLKGKIRQIAGGQPLATLLSRMGFVRVALFQNLMVIMADSLPRRLRNIDNLNPFLKQQLDKQWGRISDKVKKQYPKEKYKIYEKWRTRAGFKVSYILAKSMAQDFLIDYMKKNSFTIEFQKHIAGRIDRNQLKKVLKLRRRKVKEILSRISIEILLSEIPRNVKELIIRKENDLKKVLGVKVITDYRMLEPKRVINALANMFPDMEEKLIQNCSEAIIGQSYICYESLRKLGIDLSWTNGDYK